MCVRDDTARLSEVPVKWSFLIIDSRAVLTGYQCLF